jgi:hypothetical protein
MAAIPCLEGAQLFGLAEPILRTDSEEQKFPALVDDSGECQEVFVDDDGPVGIYHRLLSKTYTPSRKQLGDGGDVDVVADLLLVCWAFRNKIHANADKLESLIYAALPKNTTPIQTSFDRFSVFAGEFSGVPFFLTEKVMLFSMKYRVVIAQSRRECLNTEDFCT